MARRFEVGYIWVRKVNPAIRLVLRKEDNGLAPQAFMHPAICVKCSNGVRNALSDLEAHRQRQSVRGTAGRQQTVKRVWRLRLGLRRKVKDERIRTGERIRYITSQDPGSHVTAGGTGEAGELLRLSSESYGSDGRRAFVLLEIGVESDVEAYLHSTRTACARKALKLRSTLDAPHNTILLGMPFLFVSPLMMIYLERYISLNM